MAYTSGTDPTYTELESAMFIPTLWSMQVIQHVQSNLVTVPLINSSYQRELRYGHTINIPVMSEVTATEVTPGSEHTVVNAASASPKTITVDKWYAATIETSDFNDIQNRPDYMAEAAKSCGYAIAKQIDLQVCAYFDDLAGVSGDGYGSDGQTLTDDIILALMEYLDAGDVPDDGQRVIIGDASSKVDLLKIDKFIRNDYVRNPVVATGKFGDIYNMGFYTTQNLTDSTIGSFGVMMHRDAIGIVIQETPRARRFELPAEFVTKYCVDAIWGIGELRDTFGQAFYTRSQS